ncbi:hypothetical protein [Pararhizobium arenae]|uniref:hypothetical protein n=1 Tax=Pararhizobium arenae TaxID=1856850 RepID=UPI00094A9E3C|nr:hypothetical protein [Pararhizobium arenae]
MSVFTKALIFWKFSKADEKATILFILTGMGLLYVRFVVDYDSIKSPGFAFVLLCVGTPFFVTASAVFIYKVYSASQRRFISSMADEK